MDWSSERCLRSIKRRHNIDHPSDQFSKVSRLSFASLLSGAHLFNNETPRAVEYDLSHDTLQSDVIQLKVHSDASNGGYRQPNVVSSPKYSNFDILHLNHTITDGAVLDIEKSSLNNGIITDPSINQKSKQTSDNIIMSRTFSPKQAFNNDIHMVSNDRGCPDCAAGQSGHIRHIGRWRLMDSA